MSDCPLPRRGGGERNLGGPCPEALGGPHRTPWDLCPTCLWGLPNFRLPHTCFHFPHTSAVGLPPSTHQEGGAQGHGRGGLTRGFLHPRSRRLYTCAHTHTHHQASHRLVHVRSLQQAAHTHAQTHAHAASPPAIWGVWGTGGNPASGILLLHFRGGAGPLALLAARGTFPGCLCGSPKRSEPALFHQA